MTGIAPIVLLDEVVAHLDPNRRAALFDALARLGAQVWVTGADPAAFSELAADAAALCGREWKDHSTRLVGGHEFLSITKRKFRSGARRDATLCVHNSIFRRIG